MGLEFLGQAAGSDGWTILFISSLSWGPWHYFYHDHVAGHITDRQSHRSTFEEQEHGCVLKDHREVTALDKPLSVSECAHAHMYDARRCVCAPRCDCVEVLVPWYVSEASCL